ncbi:hypothetical protein MFIFM68171_05523 [Madurella fahalii]|uniref:VCBS repeat-containing protein n=1 Tax=Madurella fahalii TaxID=1157608 RepID=A0ABQ0GC19_9PEZI
MPARYRYAVKGADGYGENIEIDTGLQCRQQDIRCGDVNNDSLDDFICINTEGNMCVAINNDANPPKFCAYRERRFNSSGRAVDHPRAISTYRWRDGGVGLAPTAAEWGY